MDFVDSDPAEERFDQLNANGKKKKEEMNDTHTAFSALLCALVSRSPLTRSTASAHAREPHCTHPVNFRRAPALPPLTLFPIPDSRFSFPHPLAPPSIIAMPGRSLYAETFNS
jgi:hypothetical protein